MNFDLNVLLEYITISLKFFSLIYRQRPQFGVHSGHFRFQLEARAFVQCADGPSIAQRKG